MILSGASGGLRLVAAGGGGGDPDPEPTPDYENDFESYSLGNFGNDTSGEWHLSGTGDDRITITDVLSLTGTKCLRARWGYGHPSRTVELSFSHPEVDEYWLQYYTYCPDGTEGWSAAYTHAHTGQSSYNNKWMAFYSDSYQSEPGGAFQTWPIGSTGSSSVNVAATRGDMDGDLDLWRYPTDSPPTTINYGELIDLSTDLGRFVQNRIHLKVATQGVADGIMQLWKDGNVMVDVRNWPLYDEAGANTSLRAGYILGAANSGFAADTSILVANMKVWYSDPGWGG